MLNIATTTVDEFNKFLNWKCWRCNGEGFILKDNETIECPACDGTGDYYTEAKFIERITKPFTPTRKMQLGTAFHEILEKPHETSLAYAKANNDQVGFLASNGIAFPQEVILPCYDLIDYRFPFEVKTSKEYEFSNEIVKIISKVDQLKGRHIHEHKTNWSKYKYDDYQRSYQWRLYLNVFDAQRCLYLVFMLYESTNGSISLREIHPFDFTPYHDMEQDIRQLLEEFARFIHFHQLEEHFVEKVYKGKNNNGN